MEIHSDFDLIYLVLQEERLFLLLVTFFTAYFRRKIKKRFPDPFLFLVVYWIPIYSL